MSHFETRLIKTDILQFLHKPKLKVAPKSQIYRLNKLSRNDQLSSLCIKQKTMRCIEKN